MTTNISTKTRKTINALRAAGKPIPQTLAWFLDYEDMHADEQDKARALPAVTICAFSAACAARGL